MEDKGVDGIEIGRGGLSDASDADRGLAESLRRQLGRHGEISTCCDGRGPSMEHGRTHPALQYRIELDGVMICFSHMALRWKNQSQYRTISVNWMEAERKI